MSSPVTSSTPQQPTTPAPFPAVVWWGLFLITPLFLMQVLDGFRNFTLNPVWTVGVQFLVSTLLFVVLFVALLYDAYLKEKQKENLRREFPFFRLIYTLHARLLSRSSSVSRPQSSTDPTNGVTRR